MKILHAASECIGLAKTGGLADVVRALASALHTDPQCRADVRIALPAYRGVLAHLTESATVATLSLFGQPVRIIEGRLAADCPPIWAVDCPALFDRPGDPYRDLTGRDFADNALRFACFSQAVARLAQGATGWTPELLHLHDWQSGLAAAWARHWRLPCQVLYTIHNLAYQGVFDRAVFDALGLPPEWWHMDALEYHGAWSFMKGGINFADAITTVSPSYAAEIQTPAYGCGLDGLLRHKGAQLHGLLNGIDAQSWNPADDPLIASPYTAQTVIEGKRRNKRATQHMLGLPPSDVPLVLFIGRLTEQKGADLLLAARHQLDSLQMQFVMLGTGEADLEMACRAWAATEPDRVASRQRMDEGLAHQLVAGADLLLMPSRFEPCGLTQLYAQRYGTVPIVRGTGGLLDTVVDATAVTLLAQTATGVRFNDADVGGVVYGVRRGLELVADPATALALRRAGMAQDFSWKRAAQRYVALYEAMLNPAVPARRLTVVG